MQYRFPLVFPAKTYLEPTARIELLSITEADSKCLNEPGGDPPYLSGRNVEITYVYIDCQHPALAHVGQSAINMMSY